MRDIRETFNFHSLMVQIPAMLHRNKFLSRIPPFTSEHLESNASANMNLGADTLEEEFIPVNENKIILSDVKNIISSDEAIDSSDLMKGLVRTKERRGIMSSVFLSKVSVPVPREWQLMPLGQNLNSFGMPTRLGIVPIRLGSLLG